MAITNPMAETPLLTYEAYMAEGEIMGRYDIVEGVRVFMPSPTWEHQDILFNIAEGFRSFQRTHQNGRTVIAPLDVLIRRKPKLQVRQPDVLFISNARLSQAGGPPKKGPLEAAPELVVEIISDSERARAIEDKLKDYGEIGVQECWRVWPETRMVEVVRLTGERAEIVATYHETETIQSITFPDLTLPVASIFAS